MGKPPGLCLLVQETSHVPAVSVLGLLFVSMLRQIKHHLGTSGAQGNNFPLQHLSCSSP